MQQLYKTFKYFSPFIIYILGWITFTQTGFSCWLSMLYAWVFIPLVELFLHPDKRNLDQVEEEMAKQNAVYDYILYFVVVLQYTSLLMFLNSLKENNLSNFDIIGRTMTMGLLCGTFGINVAHELGHRKNRFEQLLAKTLLLSSLYMHFFIEHNKGHHKHVATPEDPSTAKYGQSVYAFWAQTLVGTYMSAWKISNAGLKKINKPFWSFYNEMLVFQVIQLAFVLLIFIVWGWMTTLLFLSAALIGGLLLETVNYIEHYGLSRKKTTETSYERVQPHHSWNSNHVLGRLMLFELSRHSDHHYLASRKYQILRNLDDAPQMPTGYPGMILLSLFPPAWFYVMHREFEKQKV
jgi:alkane 1-monooxygenase